MVSDDESSVKGQKRCPMTMKTECENLKPEEVTRPDVVDNGDAEMTEAEAQQTTSVDLSMGDERPKDEGVLKKSGSPQGFSPWSGRNKDSSSLRKCEQYELKNELSD